MAETKMILVSACLLGHKVRYDGSDRDQRSILLGKLLEQGKVIAFCPEVAGGLPVPRPPAEIQNGDGAAVLAGQARVLDSAGNNVTQAFLDGAEQALQLAQQHNVKAAVLKERSPSCGGQAIYDGTFSKRLKPGRGVTAALLEQHSIKVFNETQINEAVAYAASLTENEV